MTSDKRNIELLTKYAEKQGMSLEELGAKIESSIVNDNELGRRTPEEIEALFKKPKEKVTIVGYVARGANPHHLALYERKPDRLSDIWGFSHSLQLDPTFFPEVTWDSEPLKVKITITPME